jgi:mono/diheme cytochrome c family protein
MKLTICIPLIAAAIVCAPRITTADAATDWTTNCASCHALDGSGGAQMGKQLPGKQLATKNLRDSRVQTELTDADAIRIIQQGVVENGERRMNAYKDTLSDEQVKALVAYIRSLSK